MTNYSYTDIQAGEDKTPESVSFDLTIGDAVTRVIVSREAIEDFAIARGVRVEDLAGGSVEAARLYQPELAAVASDRQPHDRTIYIRSEDLVRRNVDLTRIAAAPRDQL